MKPPTPEQKAAFVSVTTMPPALGEGGDEGTAMSVTGPWVNGTTIDARYTCDGNGVAPPLAWTKGPAETKAYGIVLRNNDAPDQIDWAITNIDPGTTSLGEASIPVGAFAATNSSGQATYTAPCPPKGSTLSYTLTIYALNSLIAVTPTSSAAKILADMDASVLEVATTDFTYTR
jgi:Raf kinase inhibitor-like YbhB/YbcL family protein